MEGWFDGIGKQIANVFPSNGPDDGCDEQVPEMAPTTGANRVLDQDLFDHLANLPRPEKTESLICEADRENPALWLNGPPPANVLAGLDMINELIVFYENQTAASEAAIRQMEAEQEQRERDEWWAENVDLGPTREPSLADDWVELLDDDEVEEEEDDSDGVWQWVVQKTQEFGDWIGNLCKMCTVYGLIVWHNQFEIISFQLCFKLTTVFKTTFYFCLFEHHA